MKLLKTIGSQAVGLFIDDGSLAAAIVAWLVVVWAARSLVGPTSPWTGPILALGLILILGENTLRHARRAADHDADPSDSTPP